MLSYWKRCCIEVLHASEFRRCDDVRCASWHWLWLNTRPRTQTFVSFVILTVPSILLHAGGCWELRHKQNWVQRPIKSDRPVWSEMDHQKDAPSKIMVMNTQPKQPLEKSGLLEPLDLNLVRTTGTVSTWTQHSLSSGSTINHWVHDILLKHDLWSLSHRSS